MSVIGRWLSGLRGRLLGLIALPTGAILAMGLLSSRDLKSIGAAADEITEVRMPSIKGLELMNEGQTAVRLELANLLATKSDAGRAEALRALQEKTAQIKRGWDLYEPLPQTEEEAREWKRLVGLWRQWEAQDNRVVELETAGDQEGARRLFMADAQTSFGEAEASLKKILKINYDVADVAKAGRSSATRTPSSSRSWCSSRSSPSPSAR